MAGSRQNLHTLVSRLQVSMHPGRAQGQGRGQRSRDTSTFGILQKSLLAGKWLHPYQTQCFPITSPSLCPFGFLPHSNPQWLRFCAVSSAIAHVRGKTVCQTVLQYSTVSRSVSTCAHFMKHHYTEYTLLPD